jgi:hypothetical protein
MTIPGIIFTENGMGKPKFLIKRYQPGESKAKKSVGKQIPEWGEPETNSTRRSQKRSSQISK